MSYLLAVLSFPLSIYRILVAAKRVPSAALDVSGEQQKSVQKHQKIAKAKTKYRAFSTTGQLEVMGTSGLTYNHTKETRVPAQQQEEMESSIENPTAAQRSEGKNRTICKDRQLGLQSDSAPVTLYLHMFKMS
ncbi:hypothetical protein GDO78_018763 [Eleutherodactylus coqui]|uniref:Uncharacterized protein n=1 Tax=Eleutherodactylus coqui TaxID=57060 RepID=A0A8J6E5K3_ELECQ|nr:hypothetical protein GDO78_018763 [Eleutherodactylus coqui]